MKLMILQKKRWHEGVIAWKPLSAPYKESDRE